MGFHPGELEVQKRAGVRDTADEVGENIADFVPDRLKNFLELQRFAVLATADLDHRPWASVVTGEPGLITVIDAHTLRLGSLPFDGDPLLTNLVTESHVALLAIDLLNPRRVRVNGQGMIRDGAIYITTEQVYGNCRRYIQERSLVGHRETSRVADSALSRSASLSAAQQNQIGKADTFFIATDHAERGADVSHKGGAPGFVKVSDAHRIWFPDYNGNSMFNTLGNISINPGAGLLFIDFDAGRTLQLAGVASIDWDPKRVRKIAGAERIVDFRVEAVIDNSDGFPLVSKFQQFSRFNP